MAKVKLKDVCQVVSGATPKTGNEEFWGGDIKWVTPAELDDDTHYVNDTMKHITSEGYESASLHMLPVGTVLLSTRAPIGKIAITQSEMCCNQGFKNLVCSDAVYNEYLYRILLFNKAVLQSMGRGATFKELSKKNVENFEIWLPTIDKQRKIAFKLGRIEAVQSLVKAQITKLDELVKSRFVEMFGDPETNSKAWPASTLGEIYNVISSKRIYARELVEKGVPFLKISDLALKIDGSLGETTSHVTEERFAELLDNGQVPKLGDILVTARGTLGRCYVIQDDDCFYFQDGMITWLQRTSSSPLTCFVTALFANDWFIDDLNRNCSGTTVKYLSITDLAKREIYLPPLELQQEFAAFVAQVDKSKFIAQQQIDKLQTLYDSLAQEYFGEGVV